MFYVPQAKKGDEPIVAAKVSSEENNARLDGCKGPHKFLPQGSVTEGGRIGARTGMLRCTKCLGLVTEEQARWYVKGYKHGVKR